MWVAEIAEEIISEPFGRDTGGRSLCETEAIERRKY